MVENGEELCAQFIEAHKRCLRAEGFNVTPHPLVTLLPRVRALALPR